MFPKSVVRVMIVDVRFTPGYLDLVVAGIEGIWRQAGWLESQTPAPGTGSQDGECNDGRDDRIRTCDPQYPILVRYQAAPHPDE